jgi:malonyl CoA-acyl carrier protein transacylase
MNTIQPRAMFIFPGQGSQYKGMGSDIYQEFTVARNIYERASQILGYDIVNLSFVDPQGQLSKTEFTQVALLTHSIACLEVFRELTNNRITPIVTSGHSLGEYAALIAAGSLTLDTALKLVQKRGQLMSTYGRGKMVAVNLDVTTIRSFVNSFYCDVGGCNLPEQTVVGGTEEDLHLFVEHLKAIPQARAVYLNTEGAFHTYLMMEAAQQFRPVLDSTELTRPKVKVLSNYTGKYHSFDPSTIKSSLFFQLFHPVRWIWGMQQALKDGVNLIIEFGGGIGPGATPDQQRPNLESISTRALKRTGHHAIYLPAINVRTVIEAARFVTSNERIVSEPKDTSENAVDENWFHLFLPAENGIVTRASSDLIKFLNDLSLDDVVQLVAIPADHFADLIGYSNAPAEPSPCLELVAGCETAACVAYWGPAINSELMSLRRRLEHPAYLHKALPPMKNALRTV